MPTQRTLLVTSLLALASFAWLPGRASAQTSTVRPRITAAIDNTSRVTIPHSMHPLALPQFDVGALEGGARMERMILLLGGSSDQDHQLSVLLDSQQTKGSPDYHRWLTPDEFGQQFGPAPQDIQTVTTWLQQQGFSIYSVARSGKFIQFSGTSSQVEAAFQTRMRRYQVNGEAHVGNATNISIPAALAPVVRGIASLNNFFPKPAHVAGPTVRPASAGKYEVITPDANLQDQQGTLIHALSPADFAKIYDLNPLYNAATPLNGTGETIGIVALSDIVLKDISDFRSIFGLPATTPNNPKIIVDGADPGDVPGADVEATLDTEWSGAVAPGATVDVVISADTLVSPAAELSPLFIVDQNLAQVLNESISACELALSANGATDAAFFNSLWQQAAAQGISVFVSSGDTGAAGCDPNMPVPAPGATFGVAISGIASTPFDTAVGGTQFNETGAGDATPPNPPTSDATFWGPTNSATFESVLGYIPEKVWNESCTNCIQGDDSLGAGGGGVSILYGTPSYQTLNVTGLQATLNAFTLPNSSTHPRGVPDVSLSSAGHDGCMVCFQASCEPANNPSFLVAGGTSFASPSFAGIMAIVDQKLGSPQGLANFVLYSLAAAENFGNCNSNTRTNPLIGAPVGCVFNDTTNGNNGVPGNDVTNDPLQNDLGFPAGAGYDLATGLGSVDATNLVNAWAAAVFQGSKTTITSPASVNITHGQGVTLNVSVTKLAGGSGPTGNVALETDQTVTGIPGNSMIEGLALSGGAASTGSIHFLPGGSYNIFASYPGDGTFGGSVSSKIPVTISKEASCVQLAAATPGAVTFSNTLTNIPYGTPIAFDAIVTGAANSCAGDGFATGTLTVTDTTKSTTLTPAPITLNSEGGAELQFCTIGPPCLAVGNHAVNASYTAGNDPSFNDGTTTTTNPVQTVNVMIVTAPTATVASSTSSTVASGGSVTVTATVETNSEGVAPTGPSTVQFLNNGAVIATVPIGPSPNVPKYPLWIFGLVGVLLLYVATIRTRKRHAYAYAGFALLALLVPVLAGCGGGGGGGGGGGNVRIGAVTVVASGSGTANATAFLTVSTTLTTTLRSGTVMNITANYPGDTNYAATAVGNRTAVVITVQ